MHQIELAHMSRLSIMGEMAASLAHELNQPLHAAKNYARGSIRRLLKDPEHDAELMAALERIAEEADRAAEILRRVRDFVQKTGPHVSAISRERPGPRRGDDQSTWSSSELVPGSSATWRPTSRP